MINLHRLTIPKAALDQAPDDVRLTYLMACNLANDIAILQKLVVVASNSAVALDDDHTHPALATSLLLTKLLAGRLYEGWNWLRGGSNQHLRERLAQDKTSDGWANYVKLKAYFGKPNLVEKVRKKIGFHSDARAMQAGYQQLGEEDFVEILSEQRGNSFYHSAEATALSALCSLAENDNAVAVLGQILEEVAMAARCFGDLVSEIAINFCIDVLDVDVEAQLANPIQIDVPNLSDLRLQFFANGQNHSPEN